MTGGGPGMFALCWMDGNVMNACCGQLKPKIHATHTPGTSHGGTLAHNLLSSFQQLIHLYQHPAPSLGGGTNGTYRRPHRALWGKFLHISSKNLPGSIHELHYGSDQR